MDDRTRDNFEIPKHFWWAEGHQARAQNWTAGDFDAYTPDRQSRLQALGVSFLRAEIEKLIPAGTAAPETPPPSAAVGGRPPADWWEDCLIDLCFRHFRGELPHKTQADIVRAMQDWITARGYDAADSTIKLRARKLMEAIKRDKAAEK